MAINQNRYAPIIIGCLLFTSLFGSLFLLNNANNPSEQNDIPFSMTPPQTQAYEDVLVDRVYTFMAGEYTINLTNLQFDKGMNYIIKFAAVTDDHQCHLEINLIDPENDVYAIYTTNTSGAGRLFFNDYRELPFGAALTGLYTINFTKLDGPNMNIHLQVFEDEQCVKKLTDPNAIIRTEIQKFSKQPGGNDDTIYQYLKTQWMYKIYFARISPTRGDNLINITIDHRVRDDSSPPVWFDIYLFPEIGEVYSPLTYSFGTAMEGEYRFDTEYEQPMNHTNIIFIIVDKYKIASGNEGESPDNGTTPIPDPGPSIYVSVPVEAQIGVGLGVGLVVLLGALLVGYAKSKHAI